jgi:protein O-GlcNAc transferase
MSRLDPTAVATAQQLRRSGQLDEAWRVIAPAVSSGDPAAAEEAALIADAMGKKDQAIRLLERATAAAPGRSTAWVNLAALRAESGDHRAAAEASRVATRLSPQLIAAWVNFGSALAQCRDYGGAIQAYRSAVALEPDDAALNLDLAAAEFACGEIGTAARRLQRILTTQPGHSSARSLLLLALHHATNDPSGLARVHADFGASHGVWVPTLAPVRERVPGPLRVGLVSGDFKRHSVWYFLAPLLRRLPDQGIEIHAFYTDVGADEVTALWRSHATRFVEAASMDDAALAAAIGASDVDVLISLGGHTTAARPTLFLRRMAPVQASFLGYPGPLGSPNVDVWIADDAVAPPSEATPPATGRVARLSASYFCFQPGTTPAPALALTPEEPIVFGSFNVLGKISGVTVRLWSAVLNAVPGSRLRIKADSLQGPTVERLEREFASHGIATERLLWTPWSATRDGHLARYAEVDVALDTFPYNGATTTCEALWMGVPVVSLAGLTPASRMGRSILTAAGCAAWCVDDEKTYVDRAVELAATARGRDRLALRQEIASSALCDESVYAQGFADLLRSLAAP